MARVDHHVGLRRSGKHYGRNKEAAYFRVLICLFPEREKEKHENVMRAHGLAVILNKNKEGYS
jgi:hypothetical protein